MRQKITEIAKIQKDNNTPLLSNYDSDFWEDYVTNYAVYDRYFSRKFGNWYYWQILVGDTTAQKEENAEDFTEDVYGLLQVHAKDFSELYRINVVSDEDLSFLNNYDMTEVENSGDTYGQRIDNGGQTIGQQVNSSSVTNGAQTNTETNQVSPNDSESWFNQTKSTEDVGQKIDSTSETLGSRNDTNTYTKGSQTDTHNRSLTRKGNIGVQTATDMMDKFDKFWTKWDFYNYIFGIISRELLYCRDYGTVEDWVE